MQTERLIKGGKPEGKNTGPLFPRLHVDDTKRIRPRAPPRNKMALYDQMSSPSQRFNITSTSTLSHKPVHSHMLANVSSPTLVFDVERGLFSPDQKSFGKKNFHSHEKISGNTNENSFKRSMVEETQFPTFPSTFLKSSNPSKFKCPGVQNDEYELRLPSLVPPQLSMCSNKNQHISNDKYSINVSCSLALQTTNAKKVNTCSKVPEENPQSNKGNERNLNQISEVSNETLSKISLKSFITKENFEISDDKYVVSTSPTKNNKLEQMDTIKDRGNMDLMSKEVHNMGKVVSNEDPRHTIADNTSILRGESFHESPITNGRNLSVGNDNPCEENQNRKYLVDLEHKNEDRPHTSIKEYELRGVISPDLLVEMIGQKHFWKARKEIIDQQGIFTQQLFELHRVVKVQKMLASSGNIQKKETLSLGNNAQVEPTYMKKSLPKSIQEEAQSWHEKSTNEVPKVVIDNAIENLPLPSLSSDTTSTHTNTNLSMWCLPPPQGNQWLLPVMSPSEGLVYKPYPNPPPPPGFFPSPYNEYRPTKASTTLGNEEFLNSKNIGVNGGATPSSMDPLYFAPYGMSTFKQMNFYDVHSSSCTSNGTRNVGEAKNEIEKLESNGNYPNKKMKTSNDHALPLFPTTPTSSVDIGQPIQNFSIERKTKVIKVIPRNNPRLASESVANIVKLIQEERKALL